MKKKIIMLGIFFAVIILLQIKSYAGSFSIKCSPSGTVEPGTKVTISVTGNNATGRINLSSTNITLSQSSVWVENNTVTLTGTASNSETTAKITATATDVSDSTTAEEITGSKSVSITIKKKEVETQKPATTTQTSTKPNTQNTKPNNNKTTTTTSKPKTETKVEEPVKKEEEQSHKLGIYYVYIEGIKENGEKQEIKLDKEFNYDIFEYSCEVTEEICKLEFQKEAYEYNDLVKIEGIEELKYGENIVKMTLIKDDKEITYKINVFKQGQEKQEMQETENKNNEEKEDKQEIMVQMPLTYFILMQVGIIAVESVICILIVKNHKSKYKKI